MQKFELVVRVILPSIISENSLALQVLWKLQKFFETFYWGCRLQPFVNHSGMLEMIQSFYVSVLCCLCCKLHRPSDWVRVDRLHPISWVPSICPSLQKPRRPGLSVSAAAAAVVVVVDDTHARADLRTEFVLIHDNDRIMMTSCGDVRRTSSVKS